MTATGKMHIVKDLPNKKIIITRNFDASPDLVWRAWTESKLLDLWWAPKPWRAETKTMNFREGGHWLYAMVGPDSERQWCRVDFTRIEPTRRFDIIDTFCDENGVANNDLPGMRWKNEFHADGSGTKVTVEITFESIEGLEKVIEMGFEEGFASALGNLDHYLSTQV